MPLYEYQCKACNHRFEKIQKFSDPLVRTCPSCGKEEVEQMLSAPNVQFKGTGWYVTDYAKKNSSQGSSGGSKSEGSSSESKPESTKAESKPETKKN